MKSNSIYKPKSNISKSLLSIDWDFKKSRPGPFNNIHPYPAKFIPEIPRTLLKLLPVEKEYYIFDPFCGSGVTLEESIYNGFNSIGVDLNPIACLISRVKVNPLPSNLMDITNLVIQDSIKIADNVEIPQINNLDHWFKKDIQRSITSLLTSINNISNQRMIDALKLCLSSIIVKVSNQDSDTRYAAIEKKYNAEDVFVLFKQSVNKLQNAKKLSKNIIQGNPKSIVLNKNSLTLESKDIKNKIGLVITSPPYPNAYEYWLYHKYRMWWLGYDPIEVKDNEIGARAHYFKKNHSTKEDFIDQMDRIFSFLYKQMIPGGFTAFVIGRSKIHGQIVDNEKIIDSVSIKNGFEPITIIPRRLNSNKKSFNLSHARIKEEFIVVSRRT